MYANKDISLVKKDIENHVGSKVRLETNRSKNKIIVNEGVISMAFPSIFIVKLTDDKIPSRTLSFSYTDVLTNSVAITLCD